MTIERPETGPGREIADWWQTDIIDMEPGKINYFGYPIENLIGQLSFSKMIWLMTRGDIPSQKQTELLDAALMSAVDHGPQAPSIAIARMAATCGVGLNNAMASAVNVLGDIHGGAGEQAIQIYKDIAVITEKGRPLAFATEEVLTAYKLEFGKYIPGFGHRFHPIDPRSVKLMALVEDHIKDGNISGTYYQAAREIERQLGQGKSKAIPMNIDGATAVIYAELGFPAELARGLFCLSRSVGILAHAWEQMQSPERNKGPMPRNMLWSYTGKETREL